MCDWGTDTMVRVKVPAHLSSTGEAKWREFGIDSCIAPIVKALQEAGIDMTGSCCGHGKSPGRIDLVDGRTIVILPKGVSVEVTMGTGETLYEGDGMDLQARTTDRVEGDGAAGAALRAHPEGQDAEEGERVSTPAVQPVRLQRSRQKGARLVSPNGLPVVCVTRPGPFGNPYRRDYRNPGMDTAEKVVSHYRAMLHVKGSEPFVERIRRELRGKNLACFCPLDKPCHADVLLEIANSEVKP